MMEKFYILLLAIGLITSCKREKGEQEMISDPISQTEEITDPCDTINCLNNGTCLDGNCDCPPGYGGDSCQNVLPAVSFTITEVKVVHFPYDNQGTDWDYLSTPDIVVTAQSGTILSMDYLYATTTAFNAEYSDTLIWSGLNWQFPMTNEVTFGMWDYDNEEGLQPMGSKYIVPQNVDTGFPESIVIWQGDLKLFIKVIWNF